MKKIDWKSVCHNKDFGLLVLRVIVGVIFAIHGYEKLSAIAGVSGFFASLGIAPFWAYVVAWVEFLGGISLILGFGSKIAAFLLAIVMMTAIVKVHGPNGLSVAKGGYEYVLTLFGAAVALLYTGPGKYSVGANCGCPVGKGTCPAVHSCDCGK